jgi:predicted negative regulator of RcsB-dependent stress response
VAEDVLTEEEQVERLRQWWAEYGRLVIGGIVLGIGVLFGGQGWRDHRERQLGEASDLFQQVVQGVLDADRETVAMLADRLAAEFPQSPYDTQAMLALAKLQVEEGDLDGALSALDRAAASAEDDAIAASVRTRRARVLLAMDRAQETLDLLETDKSPHFAGLRLELVGDALVQLDRPDEARTAYQDALAASDNAGVQQLIDLKIAALGGDGDVTMMDLPPPAEDADADGGETDGAMDEDVGAGEGDDTDVPGPDAGR